MNWTAEKRQFPRQNSQGQLILNALKLWPTIRRNGDVEDTAYEFDGICLRVIEPEGV